jgi:hypothetical protein
LLSFSKFSEFNFLNILFASELTVDSDFVFAMAAKPPQKRKTPEENAIYFRDYDKINGLVLTSRNGSRVGHG